MRLSLPVLGICLLLAGAIALGVWWWNLRSATDPIDSHPVDAFAQVVASPACPNGSATTVRLTVQGAPVTATISGCGHAKDQRIAVQYLAGHPEQMRQAGTTTAGSSGLAAKLLPIGILAAGLAAVLATVALLVERRRSRHLAAGGSVSVADLRARAAAGGAGLGGGVGDGGGDGGGTGDGDGAGDDVDGGDEAVVTGTERAAGHSDGRADARPEADPDGVDGATREPGGAPESGSGEYPGEVDTDVTDTGEPSHVLPSGFVLVEEQLFTHSGTEAVPGEDRSD